MWISLLLIGIISLIVIAGTAYLFLGKNEQLVEQKKITILIILGAVIFISFLVTTYKNNGLEFASNNRDEGALDLDKVFYGSNCQFSYSPKYAPSMTIPKQYLEQIYRRNYISMLDQPSTETLNQFLPTYQQRIVYLSKKDEGASYFLHHISKHICRDRKTPVIYLKLQKTITKEEELMRQIGVSSFQQLQKHLCHYSGIQIRQGKYEMDFVKKYPSSHNPYLIIDNFQYILDALSTQTLRYPQRAQFEDQEDEYSRKLQKIQYFGQQRLLIKIITQLVDHCGVNIIINSQKQTAIQQISELWSQRGGNKLQNSHKDILPFQFHRWQGLKQYDVYKIVSKGIEKGQEYVNKIIESSKSQRFNFKQLAIIIEEIKENVNKQTKIKYKGRNILEQYFLKDYNVKLSVARYYRLEKTYKMLKNSQNKRFSYLKANIDISQLFQLQILGLIEIRDGNILLK